ncbi:MAG: HdeD family acid-resistance protein [Anaerolineae bacterium]|nr:HdeD family acid-resistance protein [Anaerolineae bacterium]
MIQAVARNWWTLALRGLAAVLFGLATFVWPDITLFVLVLMFGAYAFVDGIFALVAAFSDRAGKQRWWVLLLEGLAGIAAGILTFIWPGMTAFVLLYLIAAWAIVTGVFEVMAAIRLRREIEGEWLLALGGIASIIFGILMVIWPGAGALAVVWLIGSYAFVFGLLMIFLAFRLRSWSKHREDYLPSTS